MLNLNWTDPLMAELQDAYNQGLPGHLYCSHYDLANLCGHTPADWKRFLTDAQVADYIQQELRILQQTEMTKLLQDVSGKSKSVGTAQLVSALTKLLDSQQTKDGPAFVYCYIPLNPDERQAPNVVTLDHDPFIQP